jgi:hypothetical protein
MGSQCCPEYACSVKLPTHAWLRVFALQSCSMSALMLRKGRMAQQQPSEHQTCFLACTPCTLHCCLCAGCTCSVSSTFVVVTHPASLLCSCSCLCSCRLQIGNFYNYAQLASAGWIITTIANFCITFLLGWRPRKVASSSGFGK